MHNDNTGDGILRVLVDDGMRAYVVRSSHMLEAARQVHGFAPTAVAAIGRVMTMTAILAAELKNPAGSITVTFHGDGPLGKLIAIAAPDGRVKAMAQHPGVHLPLNDKGKLDVGGAVGRGRLSVVRDIGVGQPYVGQTYIQTGEISEDFAFYLTVSEQIPSLVALGVMVNPDGSVLSSGGLVFQAMPGCSERLIEQVEQCVPRMQHVSALMQPDITLREVLEQVTGDIPYEVVDESVPRYQCDCSRQRVERALIAMGRQELQKMIQQQGKAEVVCHFCNQKYDFNQYQLEGMMMTT